MVVSPRALACIALATAASAPGAQAQSRGRPAPHHLKILSDTLTDPMGSIVLDSTGRIFGIFPATLTPYDGDIYSLTPPQNGQRSYTLKTLFAFKSPSPLGISPVGGLVADATGTLYGTTTINGQYTPYGCGAVFSFPEDGSSPPKVLFHPVGNNIHDLCGYYAAPTRAADGAIVGTAVNGGGPYGGVYRLTPPGQDRSRWVEQNLYDFKGRADGYYPTQPLLADSTGALFGTAIESSNGGRRGVPVYKLSPPAPGQTKWNFSLIWKFRRADCTGETVGPMAEDEAGALYGACSDNVTKIGNTPGTVFRLTPPAPGTTAWTETILWRFDGEPDGHPNNGVVRDASGNLYGTTAQGNGTIFELSPPLPGQTEWTKQTLWVFDGKPGMRPSSPLVIGPDGGLFGTTASGGQGGAGVAYELTP